MATAMLQNEWVEANVRTVASLYPQFSVVQPPSGSGAILAVRGSIAPIKDNEELGEVLFDLENSRPVLIQAGRILHDSDCGLKHQAIIETESLDKNVEFEFLVLGYAPKRHPRAFCLIPDVSKSSFPDHPHLNPDSSVCPYSPSDKVLPWDARTVSTLLNYAAIWALKHHIWNATRTSGRAKWIGEEMSHHPYDMLRNVDRCAPCPCGGDRKFRDCCMPKMQQYVDAVERLLSRLKYPELQIATGPRWSSGICPRNVRTIG